MMNLYPQLCGQGGLHDRLGWGDEVMVHRILLEELYAEQVLTGGGVHQQLVYAPEQDLQPKNAFLFKILGFP